MLIKNAKILFAMTFFESRRFAMFPTEVAASVLSRLIDVTLFVTFWLIVGKYAGSGDVVPKEVISYYLIITGITSFFFTQLGIGSVIIKMIKYGELNQILIRPVTPLLVPWSQRTGRNLVNLIMGAIQIIAGVIIADSFSVHVGLLLPLVLFNTIVINLAFNFILGTTAFYITEPGGLKNTFVHIANLCGGRLIPLFLMPTWVASALQFTPFPAAQYQMAILLQGIYPVDAGFVAIGTVWAVGLMAFAVWFWRFSLGRYEAIGL